MARARLSSVWATARLLLPAILVASVAWPSVAEGQYFGRNKVQYQTFSFQVLKTPTFNIYYYPEERAATILAGQMAERWNSRLSTTLDHKFSDPQPIILYASHPQFRQTNVVPGEIGEGTGGVTEPFRRRVILPFAGPLAETDHVLGHELVHAFQFSIAGPRLSLLPLWFVEGMAEYLSVGPEDANTAMWVRDAYAQNRLPSIKQLDDPRYFPYRFGQSLWAYLAGRWGDEVVGQALRKGASRANGATSAIEEVTKLTAPVLSDQWHAAIAAVYEPLRARTKPDADHGRILVDRDNGGRLNVAPALSPDGRWMLYWSEKSQFAIELYLADARTGKTVRKVVEGATDPHFDALQFIQSGGTWAPTGDRFAFLAVSSGQPVLRIEDTKGHRELEVTLTELDEAYHPTWAPDGRRIAFTGLHGGVSDLFVYDIVARQLTRLTHDSYAEIHPAWSPDGRSLAFVTDRFGTDLATLAWGRYQLALFDLATGESRLVPTFPGGAATNPQWAPDGQSLFFVSTYTGIPNVFRVALAGGAPTQVTNVFTGVSGITSTSPALSVASQAGTVAFTVFHDGGYRIVLAEDSTELAGVPVRAPEAGEPDPANLAYGATATPDLARRLADPTTGLGDPATFASQPYQSKFGLDYVAPPTFVAGADRFGSYIGGGSALYFSDMLNRHQLVTALQINGSFSNLAAAVAYQNNTRRLGWGVTAERIPYLYGGFAVGQGTVNGEPAIIEQQQILRETHYRLSSGIWYPFSSAQRVELSGGVEQIGFTLENRELAFSQLDGRVLSNTKTKSTPFPSLTLGLASAALVYDNSLFGATSPILGQRYRLEASPVFGTLNYVGVLTDYRRYFMPLRPFTLAFRALHFGRYGSGADDGRLSDLYLGSPGLIRGYARGSFNISECQPSGGDPCPVFNQLFGSKLAVANAELRFPLLGALGLGEGYYGAFPLEFALFTDGGVAWRKDLPGTTANEPASFLGGDRRPVWSAGAALRANVLGFLVVELDWVRAFDRKKTVWEVNFIPGF